MVGADARRRAKGDSFDVVAGEVAGLLGSRLVAYIAGADQTSEVRSWVEGAAVDEGVQARVRLAFELALIVTAADNAQIAQAWFRGLNPELLDRSPASLLRAGESNVEELRAAAHAMASC
jgi:hypothetical protein